MCIIEAQSIVVGIRLVKICTDKVKFRLRTWGFLFLDDTTILLENRYRKHLSFECNAKFMSFVVAMLQFNDKLLTLRDQEQC